ncbi:MAG: MFS transporter [Candidatus Methanoperedens sp.]|nr:MFS transporter [Candidatus Methanoperedens sp.]
MNNSGQINHRSRAPIHIPFHYGWLVLSLSFLTTLIAAGIRSLPSVLIHPFEMEFGWSRVAISSAISVNLLLFGVAGPISGWLLDRFGPRRVMIGSLSVLVCGVSATSIMKEFWQLVLLWGVIVGLSAGGMGSVLSATVANRWFKERRGLALGILNSASSTGQLIFLPLFMTLVVSVGWRLGLLIIIFMALGLIPFVFLWMRDDPADAGLEPYGAGRGGITHTGRHTSLHGTPDVARSMSLLEVFRSLNFWLLAGSFFVCGGTSMGLIGTHLIPHTIDRGISQVTAAYTVGIMGGLNFVGSFLSGWMTDRVEPRRWLSFVYVLRAVSLFILPFVTNSQGLLIFAMIYGLDWFATVAPTVALTADSFGIKAVGMVYGWVFLFHQIGAALMASGAGAVRVWLGDYNYAFLAGGGLAMLAAGMALQIRLRHPEALARPVAGEAVSA